MIFPGSGGFDKLDEIKKERMVTVPMLEADKAVFLENISHSKEMIALLKDTIKDLKPTGDNQMSERDKEESDLCKKYLISQIKSVKDSDEAIKISDYYIAFIKASIAG